MFKVETYADPRKYFSNIQLETDSLHITGDSSFRLLLIQKFSSRDKDKDYVMTYEEFLEKIFPKWCSPFSQVLLKSKMRNLILQLTEGNESLRKSIIHSLDQWVNSFRFLVELEIIDVFQPPGEEKNIEQILFYEVCKQLKEDSQVRRLIFSRKSVHISNQMKHIYHKLPKAIYVYHMIQMDASRVYFFCQCAKAGIPVIFRIPFQAGLHEIYKPWEQVYQRLVPRGWAQDVQNIDSDRGRKWISYIMGKQHFIREPDSFTATFYQFGSPAQFHEYLKEKPVLQRERRVIAPTSTELNQAFRDQQLIQKHQLPLAQLPCNRFLFYLYQCKKKDNTIFLEYQDLVECITSGWIVTRDVSGVEAHSILLDLEPYMRGITNIDQVIERCEQLEQLLEISSVFDQLSQDKVKQSLIKKYLVNPFRVFSYAHPERWSITLKQLNALLHQFKQTALALLPEENKQMPLKKHCFLLRQLFDRVQKHLPLSDEEKKLLKKALQTPIIEYWNASREELQEFVQILLNQPIAHGKDANTIDGFDHLEGCVLRANEIHVTNLSIQALRRYTIGVRIEPLTLSWLREMIHNYIQTHPIWTKIVGRALDIHEQVNRLGQSYLLFQIYFLLAFSEGNVTFSWIEGLYDHDEKSSLLEMLHMFYGKHSEIPYWQPAMPQIEFPSQQIIDRPQMNGDHLAEQFPIVYWLDQDFCARKFFLTSLVELQPIYESDFHQRIAFSVIARLFSNQDQGEEEVKKYLFPLFPQWTQTLKENLLNIGPREGLLHYRSFQKVHYPKAMEKLQLLYSKYRVTKRWKVDYAYERDKSDEKLWINEWIKMVEDLQVKGEPGEHCTMCPYLMICDQGVFPIERKHGAN